MVRFLYMISFALFILQQLYRCREHNMSVLKHKNVFCKCNFKCNTGTSLGSMGFVWAHGWWFEFESCALLTCVCVNTWLLFVMCSSVGLMSWFCPLSLCFTSSTSLHFLPCLVSLCLVPDRCCAHWTALPESFLLFARAPNNKISYTIKQWMEIKGLEDRDY